MASIINQGNDVNTVFFAICISKVWSDTAVAAPHLIDMRAFITAHIPVWSLPQFDLELVDEAADCGFGNLSVYDGTIIFELSVNGCRRHAWIIRFKIPDPFLQFIIKFTAHTCIRASFRDKGIKPVVLIIQIPFFDG